jgi:hypothetical protein
MIGIIVSMLINHLIIEDLQTSTITQQKDVRNTMSKKEQDALKCANYLIPNLKLYTIQTNIRLINARTLTRKEKPVKKENFVLLYIHSRN